MPLVHPKSRGDLEYVEIEESDDTVVVVRDPVRNQYFRFNVLQAAMLRALDGRTGYDAIVEKLTHDFDVEVPRKSAEQFVARARRQMLLDISSYRVNPERARRRIYRELSREGFRFRGRGRRSEVTVRAVSQEAVLFSESIRQLERGDPATAGDYLAAVLEINPDNQRALTLHRIIQRGYLKASAPPSEFPLIPLFNPDRLLAALARTIGPFLFSRKGVASLCVLFAIAASIYARSSFDDVTITPGDVALGFLFVNLGFLLHELGHGLACRYYGGVVPEIGILLFYLINPLAYCDTSSTYLFTHRRPKVIVQLAGTITSMAVVAILLVLLDVLQRDIVIYPGLVVAFLVSSGIVTVNLMPLIKADGYYALSDALGIPNLRDRAFSYTLSLLGGALFGVAPEKPIETTARERWTFLLFGVTGGLYTIFFLYGFYFSLVVRPLMVRYQGLGLVVALAVILITGRTRIVTPLIQLARFFARHRRRIFTVRRSTRLAALLLVVVLPWVLIRRPVWIDADFVLAPRTRSVVAAESEGIIDRIAVHEGQRVRAGEVLAEMRSEELLHAITTVEAEVKIADLELAMLEQGARPEARAVENARLREATSRRQASQERAERSHALSLANVATLAATERADATAELAAGDEARARYDVALQSAGTRPEEIAAARAARAALVAELGRLESDRAHLALRSPIDGVLVTPHPEAVRGRHLRRGETVFEVHDLGAVVAEVALDRSAPLAELAPHRPIALRAVGEPGVEIHTAFDGLREGAARATETGPKGAPAAPALIARSEPFAQPRWVAGMTGRARIYGRDRPLGYGLIYLPLRRLLGVSLWSLF